MSDQPRDLTLERINRLSRDILNMADGQNQAWRLNNRTLEMIVERLDRIDGNMLRLEKVMGALASEQVLLGNRIESAFAEARRTNIRLDDIEDAAR